MKESEAQRRANNKYQLKTYKIVGCKLRREIADQFTEECKANGTTPNAIFRQAVYDYMKEHAGIEVCFTKTEESEKKNKLSE